MKDNIVIVGSQALLHHGIECRLRNNNKIDLDVFCNNKNVVLPKNLTYSNVDLKVKSDEFIDLLKGSESLYATPETILALKLSHMQWDETRNTITWFKHLSDVVWLQRNGIPLNKDLYYKFLQHWKDLFGYKSFLSLDNKSKDFFDDNVTYHLPHDQLHDIVAIGNSNGGIPLYNLALKDGQEVMPSTKKFNTLTFEQKVGMLREEISVIGLERWVIPSLLKGVDFSLRKCYSLALKKTITNLTKNTWTDFILFNLENFIQPDLKLLNHSMKQVKILIKDGVLKMDKDAKKKNIEHDELIHNLRNELFYNISMNTDDVSHITDGLHLFLNIQSHSGIEIVEQDEVSNDAYATRTDYKVVFKYKDVFVKTTWYWESYSSGGSFNELFDDMKFTVVKPKEVITYE